MVLQLSWTYHREARLKFHSCHSMPMRVGDVPLQLVCGATNMEAFKVFGIGVSKTYAFMHEVIPTIVSLL